MKPPKQPKRGVSEPGGEEHQVWTLPVPSSNKKATANIHVSVNRDPGEPGSPEPPPEWALTLKLELGMPSDSIWRRLVMVGAPLGDKWGDYKLELFGMLVDASPTNGYPWPVWLNSDPTGAPIEVVQLWRQRVTHSTSPLYSEVLWHPKRGRTASIKGLEESHSKSDLLLAWAGLELLQEIVHQGRPVGTVRLTGEQFRSRAVKAYRAYEEMLGERPHDVDLAEKLLISRATLYTYMGNYEFDMHAIEEAAQSK
ncbi:MAG: hypothetical protein ACR2H4_20045 [Pyrinomonadaceae bacterium]